MTDAECKSIEQECVEQVRKALKTITRGEIYDEKGYLNKVGYDALEEIEGLDLFWICDPLIKMINLAKEVDNAPTVDITKNQAYDKGFITAMKLYSRPQGDLVDEVWKLYEKYQSHLATRVIEFGDELKDLLGKYQKGGAE